MKDKVPSSNVGVRAAQPIGGAMRYLKHHSFAAVAALTATPAFAEVADKLASPTRTWFFSAFVAAISFLCCYFLPRAAFVALPLLIAAAWYIGTGEADILASYKLEVDSATYYAYRAHWIVASALMPLGAAIGAGLGLRKRRRAPPNTSLERTRGR